MIFNLRFRSVVRIGYREAGPKRSDVPTRLGAMIEQTAGVGGTIGCLDRIRTGWFVTPGVPMLPKFVQGLWRGGPANVLNRETSVMIEKVAGVRGTGLSEFLDLDHTGESMIGVPS